MDLFKKYQKDFVFNDTLLGISTDVADVRTETTRIVKRYMKWLVLGFIIAVAITALLFIYFPSDKSLIPLLMYGMIVGGVYAFVSHYVQRKLMRQFAERNQLQFKEHGEYTGESERVGMIFKNVDFNGVPIRNVVSGQIASLPFEFFNYVCSRGSGKHKVTYTATVLQLSFNGHVPEFFLEEKRHRFGGINLVRDRQKELQLEGNFHEYFTLFVSPDHEIEVLQILTPEVMTYLIDHASKLSFEFFDNKMFIYQDHYIMTKNELDSFFNTAQFFIQTIESRVGRMHDDVAAIKYVTEK